MVQGGDDASPKKAAQAKHKMIEVAIGDGVFTVDGQDTSFENFRADLKRAMHDAGGECIVGIKASPDLPLKKLHMVQKEMQALDARKVVYLGEEGRKLAMALPSAEQEKKLKQMDQKQVMALHVNGDGGCTLNGKPVKLEKASAKLAQMAEKNPNLVVTVSSDDGTSYAALVDALDALKKAGVKRIHIADPEA